MGKPHARKRRSQAAQLAINVQDIHVVRVLFEQRGPLKHALFGLVFQSAMMRNGV
jgi:hypothetical protein